MSTDTNTQNQLLEIPRAVLEKMIEKAGVPRDSDVIIPSAGVGANIPRALRDRGLSTDQIRLIEPDEMRAQALRRLFFYTECRDFLSYNIRGWTRAFVPPAADPKREADYVVHAYYLLTPGGVLAAQLRDSLLNSDGEMDKLFQAWLKEVKAEISPVDSGSNTSLVLIHKRTFHAE